MSTVEGSSSHLNRAESSHSSNVRSASNMISYLAFRPITVLMCITVTLYQVIPRHLMLQRIVLLKNKIYSMLQDSHFKSNAFNSPFNTSQVRTRSTTKKLNHCLENQKGYYLRNRNTGNAHAAIHLRTINQFLKLVYLRK